MNRVGQPIDIARVVCFLASQDGEWVNGKVIGIDGKLMKEPTLHAEDYFRYIFGSLLIYAVCNAGAACM